MEALQSSTCPVTVSHPSALGSDSCHTDLTGILATRNKPCTQDTIINVGSAEGFECVLALCLSHHRDLQLQ